MKQYKCGPFTYKLDDTACVFCEHCEDVLWDYTNGIYSIFCEKGLIANVGNCDGKCSHFKEVVT